MAQYKGKRITNIDATPTLSTPAKEGGGRKRVWTDVFNAADQNLLSADSVVLWRAKKGDKVIDGELIWGSMTGASPIGAVGDSDDSNRFMTLVSLGTGTMQQRYNGLGDCGRFNTYTEPATLGDYTAGAAKGRGYEYTCDKDVIFTLTNGTLTAGTLRLLVELSRD